MSESDFNLPKFSGSKLDFPEFQMVVLGVAANATSLHPHGLLGLLLSQAQFDAMYPPLGGVRQYRPIGDPNTFAIWILGHPAIPPLTVSDQRLFWKELQTDFRTILRLQTKFNAAIITAMDAATMRRISHPLTGVTHLDIEALWTAIVNDRGTITPGDLRSAEGLAQVSFDPSDPHVTMRAHIALHERAHLLFSAARAGKSEIDKTTAFLRTFSHLPLYNDHLRNWLARNPGVAQQTFAAIASAMEEFEEAAATISASATAGQMQYASTAQPNRVNMRGGRGGRSSRGGGRGTARPQQPNHYCWTHGHCFHPSATCRAKSVGHQDAATNSNTMGGNTATWGDARATAASTTV